MGLINADAFKAEGRELYRYAEWDLREVHYSQMDVECNIDNMPTIEAEPRWIPVTEKLPEEDTDVLICYRYKQGEGDPSHVDIDITSYGTVCFGGRAIHFLKEWRQPFEYFHANYEVVAWRPLPEPYREVEG